MFHNNALHKAKMRYYVMRDVCEKLNIAIIQKLIQVRGNPIVL